MWNKKYSAWINMIHSYYIPFNLFPYAGESTLLIYDVEIGMM